MFDHLIDGEFHPTITVSSVEAVQELARMSAADILDAKATTTDWLAELGVVDDATSTSEGEAATVRTAFAALTTNTSEHESRAALANVKTPKAVQHLVGMLSAYDWQFVEQARELRGYAVSKIMEETQNTDARIRLRALELLGKVTEVALFTERVEVTKKDASEEEIERRLRERLSKFLTPADGATVTDVTPTPADEDISAVVERRANE